MFTLATLYFITPATLTCYKEAGRVMLRKKMTFLFTHIAPPGNFQKMFRQTVHVWKGLQLFAELPDTYHSFWGMGCWPSEMARLTGMGVICCRVRVMGASHHRQSVWKLGVINNMQLSISLKHKSKWQPREEAMSDWNIMQVTAKC